MTSSLQLASWLLAALSIFGVWLGGQNPKWGWRLGVASQLFAWLPYSVATDQPGMIAMSFVFTALYLRSLRRWKHTVFTLADQDEEPIYATSVRNGLGA